MLLPTVVRKIIEAYGMDMALCEELQKTKVHGQSIRDGDAEFCVPLIELGFTFSMLYKSKPQQLCEILTRMSYTGFLDTEALVKLLLKTESFWHGRSGWWCMNKLEEIFTKRCKIWSDIGIDSVGGDRELIRKWINASRYLKATQCFAFDVYMYEETKDDWLIGPTEPF